MGNTNSEIESKNNNSDNLKKVNKNHFNNIELQKTVMNNRTMQKQLLDKVKAELSNKNSKINKDNYSQVNDYLTNLNLNQYERHQVQDYLNINDGYLEPNNKKADDLNKTRKEKLNENINIDYNYLFGLNKNFTLDELKASYKKLVIATHPDRPNGSEKKFKLVSEGYKQLLEELKKKEVDKQYVELRNQSKEYMENQKNEINVNITNKDDFDIKIFNKIYKENRLSDVNDTGYESWIKSNSFDTEEITKTFKGNFNINRFNNSFSYTKKNNEIIKYQEPQALDLTSKLGCTVLGLDNISSFSKQEMKNKDLNYSDYREAYTTLNTINPGDVKFKKYKNVDDLKSDRKNISFELSDEDRQNVYINKKKQELLEKKRQSKIQSNDQQIFDNYHKINKILIKRN
jgi:curved DNA-binding protein CbpA